MRLSPETRHVIKQSVLEIFGPEATVRLFGSRTDDAARGGDVDLLVECGEPVHDPLKKSLALNARLQLRLGEQQFDILVADPLTQSRAVHEVARRTGIVL